MKIWYHPWPTEDRHVDHADLSANPRWNSIQQNVVLKDKTVLDIGAFDGFFSFKAEMAGASDVLATDKFIWFEAPDWSGCKEHFNLVRDTLGSKVRERVIDPSNINPVSVGEFDVVFLLGVIYHRVDFYQVFENAASVCKETLVVSTHVDLNVDQTRPAFVFYPNDEFFDDPTNWFVPNPLAVTALFDKFGFNVEHEDWVGKNSVVFFGRRR